MVDGHGFRELLVADVALRQGAATPEQASAALEAYWGAESAAAPSVLAWFTQHLGLGIQDGDEIEREVDALVAAADGDARRAFLASLRSSRSMTQVLANRLTTASKASALQGVGAEASLRTMASDRYAEFIPAGEGGMGVVYMALDTELHRMVAFKMIRPVSDNGDEIDTTVTPLEAQRPSHDSADSEQFYDLEARFLQEAWVTGGLEHPGVVPVYELGRTPSGIPYYTMKFIGSQRTLTDALDELRDATVEERLALLEPFLKLCDTVSYAHASGVIHRDLKPDNVALGDFGEVLLLDWGLAKLQGEMDTAEKAWQQRVHAFRDTSDLRTVAAAMGTPGYMAPEAARGRVDEVDTRSDVYSLGVILFEILTSRLPWKFETFIEFVEKAASEDAPLAHELTLEVPKSLSLLCAHALTRDKTDRIDGAQALARSVRRWQTESAVDREVADLLGRSEASLRAAEEATAEDRLHHIDEAAGSLTRVLGKRPDHEPALRLQDKAAQLREETLQERERLTHRRTRRKELLRVAAGICAAGLVAGLVVMVIGLIRHVKHTQRESEARHQRDRAAHMSAKDAILVLEDLVRDYARTDVKPQAHFELGERYVDDGRRERGQATWASVYAEHPRSAWARKALLRLGDSFLAQAVPARALTVAKVLLSGRTDPAQRAQALLLATEATFALGDLGPAQGWRDLCAESAQLLPRSGRERLDALSDTMVRFGPRTEFGRVVNRSVLLGKFRAEDRCLLAVGTEQVRLLRLEDGRLSSENIVGVDLGGAEAAFAAADMTGDGVDELVQHTKHLMEATQAAKSTEYIRVYDLRGKEAKLISEVESVGASPHVETGDVDGDGHTDVVVSMSYPVRGIQVWRNTGNGHLEPMKPGALEEINLGRSDVRATAVVDLDGNGRNEIVVPAERWSLYSVYVFEYEPESKTFIKRYSNWMGMVFDVAPWVAEGNSAPPRVYLGLAAAWPVSNEKLERPLAPQGMYSLRWDAETADYLVEPLETYGPLRPQATHPDDPDPLNVGVGRLAVGNHPTGKGMIAAVRHTYEGVASTGGDLFLVLPGAALDRGFTLAPYPVSAVLALDVDGDEEDEIVSVGLNVPCWIFGFGTPEPAVRPNVEALEATAEKTGASLDLDVAQRLLDFGFPGLGTSLCERALESLRGTAEEDRAYRLLVSLHAAERRYDDALATLEAWRREARNPTQEPSYLSAAYLERLWRLSDAHEHYLAVARGGGVMETQLRHAASRRDALAHWARVREVPIPESASWRTDTPNDFTFPAPDAVSISTHDTSRVYAWLPLTASDTSFELLFDLKIESLTYGQELGIGLLTGTAGQTAAHGIYAQANSTSGQERSVTVRSEPNCVRIVESPPRGPGRGLERDKWYRVRCVYDARHLRCGLAVHERHTGRLYGTDHIEVVPGEQATELRLGVFADSHGWNGTIQAHVQNIRIAHPRSAPGSR